MVTVMRSACLGTTCSTAPARQPIDPSSRHAFLTGIAPRQSPWWVRTKAPGPTSQLVPSQSPTVGVYVFVSR